MDELTDRDVFIEKNASLFFWETEDDVLSLKVAEKKGSFVIWGYEILSCPLIPERDVGKDAMLNCYRRQKVLLDALRKSLFFSASEAAIELRFIHSPNSAIIRIILALRVFTGTALTQEDKLGLQKIVHGILPDTEYEFKLLSSVELSLLLALPADSGINYIRKPLTLLQVGDVNPLKTGKVPWSGAELRPQRKTGLSISPTTDSKLLDSSLSGDFYSVPGFECLAWNEGNWQSVFRVMQGSRFPVVLRIALFAAEVFPQEQALADQNIRFLTTHQSDSKYPEHTYSSYLLNLSKYAQPNRLCSSQIMVASPDFNILEALSNTLPSEIAFGNQAILRSFLVSLLPHELIAFYDHWALCREWLNYDLPELKNIEEKEGKKLVNDKARSFVKRAPLLLDEMEASLLFRLPVGEGLVGIRCVPQRPFYPPNPLQQTDSVSPDEEDTRQISIGRVMVGYREGDFHKVMARQFSGHACAFGMTGAGKSNAIHDIITSLATLDPPVRFTVFEPTMSEYFSNLKRLGLDVHKLHLDSPWQQIRPYRNFADPEFLRINPFAIPQGIKMIRHCSLIKSCIMAAWPLYGIMPVILENALIKAYNSKGWDLFDDGKIGKPTPTLTDLKHEIEKYINDENKFRHEETKQQLSDAFVRRFENLLESSALGYCLNEEQWTHRDKVRNEGIQSSLNTILNKSCVVQLEGLADDGDKALIMATLLSMIYEHYQTKGKSKFLRHVLIMEESHRLLSGSSYSPRVGGEGASQSSDSRTKAIQLFLDLLAESRKLGLGLVCVDQLPTALRPEVVKQANLKIMFRLAAEDDRAFLGESMGLDKTQQANVTSLRTGDAIIYEQNLDSPILVRFPKRI